MNEEVCEWFETYIDNKDCVLVFKFSDGTVKKAKIGKYMHDVKDGIAYKVGYYRGLEEGRESRNDSTDDYNSNP